MEVTLIDYTGKGSPDPARSAANLLVFTKSTRLNMEPGLMEVIEKKPWDDIQDELRYMANTIPSSWEFIHYSFLLNGVSRAFTHQFVRTRTGSYAQQTMRVLDVDGWEYLTGPSIESNPKLKECYEDAMNEIGREYRWQIQNGAKIEDARGILPTNILTNICASFNLRTLSEIFRKRASSRTQGEYRDVIDAMKAEVVRVHPWTEMFFERSFDVAAKELEGAILYLATIDKISEEYKTMMIKLIDQMRTMQ